MKKQVARVVGVITLTALTLVLGVKLIGSPVGNTVTAQNTTPASKAAPREQPNQRASATTTSAPAR